MLLQVSLSTTATYVYIVPFCWIIITYCTNTLIYERSCNKTPSDNRGSLIECNIIIHFILNLLIPDWILKIRIPRSYNLINTCLPVLFLCLFFHMSMYWLVLYPHLGGGNINDYTFHAVTVAHIVPVFICESFWKLSVTIVHLYVLQLKKITQ